MSCPDGSDEFVLVNPVLPLKEQFDVLQNTLIHSLVELDEKIDTTLIYLR